MTESGPPHLPADDPTDADVWAQAVHLRRLSQRLDQLTDDHTRLAQQTDRIAQIAADLQHDLKPSAPPVTPGPPCWPTMTADQAAPAWESLATWVADILVPWYQITRNQLPDCWALHRPVIIELSWLHHTHHAAHQPDGGVHLTAEWHTHWKPAALRHIHDAIPRTGHRSCTPGYHLATDTERTPTPAHRVTASAAAGQLIPWTPPTDQLAHRQHWHPFYTQAVTDDLATRPGHPAN